MNYILYDFFKQTVANFSDFSSKIRIGVNNNEIKSTSRDFYYDFINDLASIEFENSHISSFEQLNEELVEILKDPFFMKWLKKRDSSFEIYVDYGFRNKKGTYDTKMWNLVEICNGSISIDYYRKEISTIYDLNDYISSFFDSYQKIFGDLNHHLRIKDNALIVACLIAATHISKEDICTHYGIDPYLLENKDLDCYPITKRIVLTDRNNREMPHSFLVARYFQDAVKIINALNKVSAKIEVELEGKVDIVK